MNHYDGPAFYRKFVHDGTVNKNNKVKARREQKFKHLYGQRNVTDFSRDVQRADFDNFKPFKTRSSHIDLQNNPIAKITAEFKPRRHYGSPNQVASKSSSSLTEFQRVNNHYQRLTTELSPSDEDVTLLANSSNNSMMGLKQMSSLRFKLSAGSSDSEVQSPQTSQAKKTLAYKSIASSSLSSLQRVKSKAATKSKDSKSVTNDDSAKLESSIKSNPASVNSSIVSLGKSKLSKTTSSSNDITDSVGNKVNSKSSNHSSDNNGPLGHNIASIMHDESHDIKNNLDLFKRSFSNVKGLTNTKETPVGNSNSSNESSRESTKGKSSQDLNSVDGSTNSESISGNDQLNRRPDFVAQNPTNVQPSNDFDDSDSEDEKHHEIQPAAISDYHFPSHDLLVAPKHYDDQGLDNWILNKAETLNKTLRAFNVNAQVVDWTNGPTVTQFQVKLHLGVKVSKINHLSNDLKMALAAKDIRIQAPIPGKTTCGIEIPNPKPRPVMLSEVVNSKTFKNSKSDLTIALGVDLTGKPRVTDLRKMPHGLIAGATGSGKSVFINCMLVSLMYKATPQELKMILIDPKAVEFAPYNGIPYLLSPVISEPKQAAASLKWATKEMNQRYEKLAAAGVRNIEQFNQKAENHHQPQMKMPYILIVIDELADLMMVAGDEIETYIVRITQKARAAGIHLIVATQRPSVDVITGTMKNNIPTRVAFMVSSQVDSRTIIDQSGAERLLGKGDMLFLGNGSSHPIRLQGCFVSNHEIDQVAGFARHQEPAHYAFHPGSLLKHVSRLENQDKLMPQVLAYIAKEKNVSTSKLQRVFSIGYNRSARIIDDLERHGYISGQEGSKPRDIYLTEKDYKKLNL